MDKSVSQSNVKAVRPSDVFNGATVRRRFVAQVLAAIKNIASGHTTFIEGTMVSSGQGDRWEVPGGSATHTAPFWGRPRRLVVEGEEARAQILLALGVEAAKKLRTGASP